MNLWFQSHFSSFWISSEASFSQKIEILGQKMALQCGSCTYNQNTTVGSWTKLDSVKDLNFRLSILEAEAGVQKQGCSTIIGIPRHAQPPIHLHLIFTILQFEIHIAVWWTWFLVYFKLEFYRLQQAEKSSSLNLRCFLRLWKHNRVCGRVI